MDCVWFILVAVSKKVLIMRGRRKDSFKCVLVIFCATPLWKDCFMLKTYHVQEHSLNNGIFLFIFFLFYKSLLSLYWAVTSWADGNIKVLKMFGIWSDPRLVILSLLFSFLFLFFMLYLGDEWVVVISPTYKYFKHKFQKWSVYIKI